MPFAPLPPNEKERLAALYQLQLLDTPPERRFDRISRLAVQLLDLPIAYVSLLDGERQWYKSICGISATSTGRRESLCSHTILSTDSIICPNTLEEPRFADNPYVLDAPNIRIYMGHPLSTPDGYNVGTFCAMGFASRPISDEQVETFRDLAGIAQTELNFVDVVTLQQELLERKAQLRQANEELETHNRFIREVFGRFVTEQVADKLLHSPEGLKLGGEYREVSILMSDLRNFTSISEKCPAEQIVQMLNRYLARMVPIIEKHGGTIDEFIGDAILVIFGAPLPCAEHARQAAECALEMQLAMEEFHRENLAAGMPRVPMGIAVNTGSVVVGNIGSDKRMKYGVVGSPVNLTARIQSFTLGGQVLVSETTFASIHADARVDGHLRVKVKGVEDHISIYEIGGLPGLELPIPPHFIPQGRAVS